jgi:hypothetical protein
MTRTAAIGWRPSGSGSAGRGARPRAGTGPAGPRGGDAAAREAVPPALELAWKQWTWTGPLPSSSMHDCASPRPTARRRPLPPSQLVQARLPHVRAQPETLFALPPALLQPETALQLSPAPSQRRVAPPPHAPSCPHARPRCCRRRRRRRRASSCRAVAAEEPSQPKSFKLPLQVAVLPRRPSQPGTALPLRQTPVAPRHSPAAALADSVAAGLLPSTSLLPHFCRSRIRPSHISYYSQTISCSCRRRRIRTRYNG